MNEIKITLEEYIDLRDMMKQFYEIKTQNKLLKNELMRTNVRNYKVHEEGFTKINSDYDFAFSQSDMVELLSLGITLADMEEFAHDYKNKKLQELENKKDED